ncbi:hypothetical protein Tco_0907271 [Tanacetum coccineum]|uniref:Retrotransposon gag domain-containing protein n=1 Tax=Tanacetum coccineum TaxID=301880 RepID=A0ABQ5CIS5_9ASTR
MEIEARLSREAWRRSMDASDLARREVMSLRTTVPGQMSEIRKLHVADCRRQAMILEMLKTDQRRFVKMRALRTTDHIRQQQLIQTLTAMSDQVSSALAARDANRNGDDSHTSGTGGRRTERVVREFTYQDFMKCKPLYFKGTKGVIQLTQWFERMETVLPLSKPALWKFRLRRTSMKAVEAELWNLKVKGTDVIGYNQRFQELALLCVRMFPEESDKIEREWWKRSYQGDLNPYALNETITTTVRCAPKCHKCNKVGHFAVTVGCMGNGKAMLSNTKRHWVRPNITYCFEVELWSLSEGNPLS